MVVYLPTLLGIKKHRLTNIQTSHPTDQPTDGQEGLYGSCTLNDT